jgi:diguanylate cyclase (GGDEF)-like protein
MHDLDRAVSSAEESLMQFLYQAPVGLVQFAIDGKVEMMNPMAAQLLMPLSPIGSLDNLYAVLDGVAPQLRRLASEFKASSGTVCDSLRIGLAADRHRGATAQVLAISLMKLDAGRLMAMVSDATQAVQREEQGLSRRLKAASRVDELTKMPNREVARELIAQTMACAASDPDLGFAVLFINCDRFRQINDALGHAAGDEVLGLIADRLRSALRRRRAIGDGDTPDVLAARLGGDEFVVLLGDLHSPQDAHVVAQRLVDTLGKPYAVRGQQLRSTVSIGVVFSDQAEGDADVVLQDASIAMAEAKRAGGSRFVAFEPAMQQRAAQRSGLESDMRQGLAQGQFFVAYQPVVGLQGTGGSIDQAAGVEALVRWRHPQRGVVPPMAFIGVAEDCGLIGELGHFVLATACRDFVSWQTTLGHWAPRLLAVNLSRGQLTEPGFLVSVEQVLAESGMPPSQLQMEVTESLAAQDEAVRASLVALKALGLTLALDDFGTGYSSLASLHLLPVDTVKIDRSFVSEAVTSAHHRVLIEATVRVARSLQMSTVAEGIETAGQAAVVRELGCDKGQGYLFSKPLLAAELALWLKKQTAAAEPTAPGSSPDPLREPPQVVLRV